jgi:Domain of unknown function (DUF4383)
MSHTHGVPTNFDRARTPAQWYCLLAGLALLLAGAFGFLADASFDTGNNVQGGSFLGFEINGIHNLVHVASGLLLLAGSRTRPAARAVAIAFGATYGLVALIGLLDGGDVLGLIPINSADNALHVGLALLGLVAGLVSRNADRAHSTAMVDRATNPMFERNVEREERERSSGSR